MMMKFVGVLALLTGSQAWVAPGSSSSTHSSVSLSWLPTSSRSTIITPQRFHTSKHNNNNDQDHFLPTPSSWRLSATSPSNNNDDNNPTPTATTNIFSSFNPFYGTLWIAFLSYGILGPGTFFSDVDNEIVASYLADPAHPQGIPPLFLAVFNDLGIMPLILSFLIFPQGDKKADSWPAAPFCIASAAMGYGGLGPYLAFGRRQRQESTTPTLKTQADLAWGTRNVLENKFVNVAVLLLCLNIVTTSIMMIMDTAAAASSVTDASMSLSSLSLSSLSLMTQHSISEYQTLAIQSKLVTVSSVDLAILTLVAATLIPRDYQLRGGDPMTSKVVGAATMLFPVVGAALYCVGRPALPKE